MSRHALARCTPRRSPRAPTPSPPGRPQEPRLRCLRHGHGPGLKGRGRRGRPLQRGDRRHGAGWCCATADARSRPTTAPAAAARPAVGEVWAKDDKPYLVSQRRRPGRDGEPWCAGSSYFHWRETWTAGRARNDPAAHPARLRGVHGARPGAAVGGAVVHARARRLRPAPAGRPARPGDPPADAERPRRRTGRRDRRRHLPRARRPCALGADARRAAIRPSCAAPCSNWNWCATAPSCARWRCAGAGSATASACARPARWAWPAGGASWREILAHYYPGRRLG